MLTSLIAGLRNYRNLAWLLVCALAIRIAQVWYTGSDDWKTSDVQNRLNGASGGCEREDTKALDGFRSMLTIGVFSYHVGWTVVEFSGGFIVLSGCVLSLSRRKEPGSVKNPFMFDSLEALICFFVPRLLKVMSVLWVIHWSFDQDFSLDSFFPYAQQTLEWFVQVIIICYLCYPALERVIIGTSNDEPVSTTWLLFVGTSMYALKVSIVAAAFLTMDRFQPKDEDWFTQPIPLFGVVNWYSFWLFRLPEFVMGMVIPHLASKGAPGSLQVFGELLCVFLLASAVLIPETSSMSFTSMINCLQLFQSFVWPVSMWACCFGAQPSVMGRVLSSPLITWLSTYSYPFYLLHLGIFNGFGDVPQGRNPPLLVAATFIVTLLFSWALVVMVEEPIASFSKRLRK